MTAHILGPEAHLLSDCAGSGSGGTGCEPSRGMGENVGTQWNEPSSSAMAASVGFALLLPLPRLPFCDALAVRVTERAPCPPATVGRPTPSLYCVSFARLVRAGGAGATEASEGGADRPLVN